eukprot:scaffold3644_cov107-Isochrysis_galbana.AAC.2
MPRVLRLGAHRECIHEAHAHKRRLEDERDESDQHSGKEGPASVGRRGLAPGNVRVERDRLTGQPPLSDPKHSPLHQRFGSLPRHPATWETRSVDDLMRQSKKEKSRE